jgi:hypothetical protein
LLISAVTPALTSPDTTPDLSELLQINKVHKKVQAQIIICMSLFFMSALLLFKVIRRLDSGAKAVGSEFLRKNY